MGLTPLPAATPADLPRKGGGKPSARHVRTFAHAFLRLLHLLHIDADGAAAGEPDLPRGLVGNAEFERLRLAALDHVERLGHYRALDAAAGDTAEEIAFIVDH